MINGKTSVRKQESEQPLRKVEGACLRSVSTPMEERVPSGDITGFERFAFIRDASAVEATAASRLVMAVVLLMAGLVTAQPAVPRGSVPQTTAAPAHKGYPQGTAP
ncbi:Protein of unknown function [Gryllus bimaculatus]|nr:Protein of unknown function [Gryllus bimaculatus]